MSLRLFSATPCAALLAAVLLGGCGASEEPAVVDRPAQPERVRVKGAAPTYKLVAPYANGLCPGESYGLRFSAGVRARVRRLERGEDVLCRVDLPPPPAPGGTGRRGKSGG